MITWLQAETHDRSNPHLACPIVRASDEAVARLVERAVRQGQDVGTQHLHVGGQVQEGLSLFQACTHYVRCTHNDPTGTDYPLMPVLQLLQSSLYSVLRCCWVGTLCQRWTGGHRNHRMEVPAMATQMWPPQGKCNLPCLPSPLQGKHVYFASATCHTRHVPQSRPDYN